MVEAHTESVKTLNHTQLLSPKPQNPEIIYFYISMNIKSDDDPNAMLFDENQGNFETRERAMSRTMTITSNDTNNSFTTSVYAPEE